MQTENLNEEPRLQGTMIYLKILSKTFLETSWSSLYETLTSLLHSLDPQKLFAYKWKCTSSWKQKTYKEPADAYISLI